MYIILDFNLFVHVLLNVPEIHSMFFNVLKTDFHNKDSVLPILWCRTFINKEGGPQLNLLINIAILVVKHALNWYSRIVVCAINVLDNL